MLFCRCWQKCFQTKVYENLCDKVPIKNCKYHKCQSECHRLVSWTLNNSMTNDFELKEIERKFDSVPKIVLKGRIAS